MNKKYKLRMWVKVAIILTMLLFAIIGIKNTTIKAKTTKQIQIIKKEEKVVKTEKNGVLEDAEEKEENIEEEHVEKPIIEYSNIYETRMTSFWANDGYGTGECTGSGLCSWDFQINDKGWYTWNGKLVIATATTYLANQGWYVADGVHLRQYGDEVTLVIDGIEYDAIVKDSCGNCMKTDRVDLFVSNGSSARDTYVTVIEK